MARPDLTINISADASGGNGYGSSQANNNSNYSSLPPSIPEHYSASRSPPPSIPERYTASRSPPASIPEHYATSRSPPASIPEHYTASRSPPPTIPERVAAGASLRHAAPSKESFRDYTSSIHTDVRPSRHSSLASRPTAVSPPPMSYHSTTPIVQSQPQVHRPRASQVSMGTNTNTTVTTVVAAIEADPTNGWRPSWLRKTVVSIFVGVFILLGICAEIVMAVADGTEAKVGAEGVWMFLPVIIISIIAALWWRVEFQALNYTPWIVLDIDQGKGIHGASSSERRASRTILLDYVSMNYPQALFTAIRNQHYLAAASIVVSLLLRVQIFLSTGIFQISGGGSIPQTLVVQPAILHSMVGIFGFIALIAIPMTFSTPGAHGITPRDPTTIAGTAALLANSCQPMSKLRGTGSQSMDVVAHKLKGSWCTTLLHQPNSRPTYEYRLEQFETQTTVGGEKFVDESEQHGRPYTPWTHQAYTSVATILISAGFVGGLWAIFTIKGPDRRFEADEGAYFMWTSFVTLLFVALSMFVSSISFQVQRLAPYFKLLARACSYDESLGLNYTNAMSFRTIVKASRYRDWGVVITTIVAFIGWLTPIFSAGLFVDRQTERQIQAQIQQQTFFKTNVNTADFKTDKALVQSVLLDVSPKYPAWTYEDLAYPSQHLVTPDGEWTPSGDHLVAKVPATKANLNCEMVTLPRSDALKVQCEPMLGDGEKRKAIVCTTNQYVGFTASSCTNIPTKSAFNYVWGSCVDDASLTILMCNETIVDLSVQTTFEGERLAISNTSFPIPDESSETPSGIELGTDNAYELVRGTGSEIDGLIGLDDFFRTLVMSRLAGAGERLRERLGTPTRANSVAEAIKLQHGIIRAQTLNSNAVRTPFESTSEKAPPRPIDATLTYYVRKIVQSTAQTALLTAALALIVVLTLIWLLLVKPSPAALPKNPGSIAAQASLLVDSSLWWHLPRGVEWLAESKLARRLRRKTFRLGWFEVMAPGPDGTTITERACTIGVVQDNGRAMRAPWDEGDAWTGSTRRGAEWRRLN